jgi:hypothetical protein
MDGSISWRPPPNWVEPRLTETLSAIGDVRQASVKEGSLERAPAQQSLETVSKEKALSFLLAKIQLHGLNKRQRGPRRSMTWPGGQGCLGAPRVQDN